MKKNVLIFGIIFFVQTTVFSQILVVGEVEQEQTEWCWAGVTKCIVDYYGDTTEQCEIADYTRSTASWHNFGTVDCCNDPTQGCNYWNYNYGASGSIRDILLFFSGVTNYGSSNHLTKAKIADELTQGRPFVIRWGWTSGGGHFVVGYGKSGNTIYYMNPWYGEGKKFADYDWVVNNGDHDWTHTNVLTTSPTAIETANLVDINALTIVPNPSAGKFSIQFENVVKDKCRITIVSINGQTVFEEEIEALTKNVDLSLNIQSGMYFIKVNSKSCVMMDKLLIY